MQPDTLALGALWYVAFLLSLTCHEAAHALAGALGGDPTAAHGGQVTLNPLPHMRREPFGTVFVPIASYFLSGWMIGWASAPYDPEWRRRYPRRAAWMALCGPLANFALVLVASAAIHIGIALGDFTVPASVRFTQVVAVSSASAGAAFPGNLAAGVAVFLSILFSLNLLLGAFNLLPVPPLDGNSAIGLLMPENTARRFAEISRNGSFAVAGLLLSWVAFGYIFQPLFLAGVNCLYP